MISPWICDLEEETWAMKKSLKNIGHMKVQIYIYKIYRHMKVQVQQKKNDEHIKAHVLEKKERKIAMF